MIPLLAVMLLGGQDAAGAASPDGVEVEIAVIGTADVPAQGYRVAAYFIPDLQGSGEDPKVVKARVEPQIRALGTIDRAVCGSTGKTALIGNEAVGGPTQDPLPGLLGFDTLFLDRKTAEQAVAILEQGGAQVIENASPVLFDCKQAVAVAQSDALAQARPQADGYSRLLGLRITGIRRISQSGYDNPLWPIQLPLFDSKPPAGPDQVRVSVPVKVTYRLER